MTPLTWQRKLTSKQEMRNLTMKHGMRNSCKLCSKSFYNIYIIKGLILKVHLLYLLITVCIETKDHSFALVKSNLNPLLTVSRFDILFIEKIRGKKITILVQIKHLAVFHSFDVSKSPCSLSASTSKSGSCSF